MRCLTLVWRSGHMSQIWMCGVPHLIAPLGSILDSHLSGESSKFQLTRWSHEMALIIEEIPHMTIKIFLVSILYSHLIWKSIYSVLCGVPPSRYMFVIWSSVVILAQLVSPSMALLAKLVNLLFLSYSNIFSTMSLRGGFIIKKRSNISTMSE